MKLYHNMTDREIDALVSERLFGNAPQYIGGKPHYLTDPYSSDDNAVRLVRDRIAERGLQEEFIRGIKPGPSKSYPGQVFCFMQATPRQQCIAALMALAPQTAQAVPAPATPEAAKVQG